MKNVIFKVCGVVLILLVILVIFHLYKYLETTTRYEITQQKLDFIDGNQLYMNKDPLIITFIEDIPLNHNIDNYLLKTALTIKEKYIIIDSVDEYISQKSEICLMRPKKDTVITLINPKFSKFFDYLKKDENFKYYNLEKENYSKVQSIDIVLHKHNIFAVPRFWLFKLDNKCQVDTYLSHNIFTHLFSLFI